jgi:crotonobetainyl-CoA:carnitine CoA-transferase CaiB-like acyl-CoA transferase
MLGPRGAAIGPVNRGADVLHDAHVKARCGVVEVEGVPLPANPIRLRDISGTLTTTTNTTPPAAIGADTESMLAAVGYSPDEIDQLRVAGVVG